MERGKHENPDILTSLQSNRTEKEETPQENIFTESMKQLFSTEDMSMKTEFTRGQVIPFAMAEIYIEKYHSKALRHFIDEYMLKAVSIERKGREDYLGLIRNANTTEEDNTSLMDRLLGKR